MATEYGLMVTLISVLVGGLVAAFGAHLIPDPCTLFQVCSSAAGGGDSTQQAVPGPGQASDHPPLSPGPSVTTDSSPSASPSTVACPSPSVDVTPADTCPLSNPSVTATASP